MKPMMRACLLLLALLMALSTLAACNNSTPSQETETEKGSTTESASSSSSSQGSGSESETDQKKEDPQFPGKVLQVLCWTSGNVTEYEETTTQESTIVEKAVFDRCDQAEARLGLRTKWTMMSNSGFVDHADVENANGGKYDMIGNTSSYSQSLMTRGVLSNLKRFSYFDFEHESWNHSILEDVTVSNKLYFATGDISTNLIFMTSVVFFNKDLVKDLGINEKIKAEWGYENLYELVTEGKWTLDKMFKLCENTYKDLNNDGKKNTGDRFGLNTYNQLLENFYYGGGYTTVVVDGDTFSMSDDFMNAELVGNVLNTVNTFLHDTKDGFYETGGHSTTSKNFADKKVLFSMAPASHAYNVHSNTEDLNYGALPIPKHSESQTRYACTQSLPYTMYSIASQSKNGDATAAFMQVLAEESYEITRPALFDKMMKGRYAEDPIDAQMWEYAVDANVFDVGRIFSGSFATADESEKSLTINLFRNCVVDDNQNWSKVLSSYAVPLYVSAANLTNIIAGIPD